MGDYYDFSLHKCCISFEFNNIILKATSINNEDHDQNWGYGSKGPFDMPSILYNTDTGVVVARGTSATEKWQSKEYQENACYVRNVFVELHNIFLMMQQEHYEANIPDSVVKQEAVKFLQDEVSDWEKYLKSPKSDFYYAFTLPTDWNEDIRKSLLRPLFIQAGLITEKDHDDRLIFFSKLETVLRYIQSRNSYSFENVEIENGKQYAFCSLDFDDEVCVNLELFTARFPSLTSIDSRYTPQSLKSVNFRFPFKVKEKRTCVKESLERRCSTKLTPEFIDMMTLESEFPRSPQNNYRKHNPNEFRFEDNHQGTFDFTSFQVFLNYQPFKGLRNIRHNKFRLKQKEMKNIESITINDIYVNYPDNVKTFFLDKISSLFHDTSGKKISGLFIFFTEEYAHNYEKLVLLKLIEKWLNDYGKQQKLFKLMAHDDSPNKAVSFRLVLEIKMFGGEKLVKKRIIESKKFTDPKILPLNSEAGFFKPIYFINIDLLPTTVNLQITHAGDTGHIKSTTENYQCDIQPLTNFISQPNLYDRSALCITYRMKLFIQNTFRKYLKLWSHPDKRTKVINTFVYPESKIVEKLLCKVDMDTMFSKKIALSAANGDNSVIVCHPGYFFFFIITYLYYLNKLIEDKMDSAFGNDWRDKNTAFAFSVEKKLLDDIFGSKETLNEMLFASGILHNNNGFRKAEICTYGEEILPAIQQKLKDADFKMKLYFIVAQLHQKHIQLTLHQVVKLSTPAEDAATIIIQDEILHIEDVHDTLCKNIWAALLSSNRIDYCLKHMNKGDDPHSLNSSEGYKAIYQRLKFYLMEVLSLSHVGIDMDYTYHLKITEECSCTIVLFLRDIIEKGIKPIIQNTATTIAASMTNSTLFGHYDIGFLFLLGDPFKLLTSSPLYIMYTAITQKAINFAIESKAKDLQGVVFQESIYQLLKQATSEKPYLYDRFIKGVLSQISTKTYGVRFGVWGNTKHYSFLCMDCSKDGENTVVRDGNFLIILQKGKPIPIAGVSIKLKFHMEDKSEEDDIFSNFYKHNPGKGVVAEFIKVQHSDNAVPGRYTLLEANSDGPKCEIHIDDNRSHNQPVIIDFKHLNYDYTLQLSARLMGFYTDLQRWNFKEYRIIGQPLTLAYIQSDTQVDSAKHQIKKREKIRNAANCTIQ